MLAPFSVARERSRIMESLARFGVEINPELPVGKLTPAQRTIVAIIRALDGWADGDHLLVLDEPTATLHDDEIAVLLDSVRAIAAEGVGVIYISHRLSEVIDLADRAVILRNGRVAAEYHRGEYSQRDLLSVIAGNPSVGERSQRTHAVGEVVLRVRGLSGSEVRGVDFDLHAGEVVGVAGLIGSGMEQLNGLIFGAATPSSGIIEIGGVTIPARKTSSFDRVRNGISSAGSTITRRNLGAHCSGESYPSPLAAVAGLAWGHLNCRRNR